MTRRYEMASRTQAMKATRERILDAAADLFEPVWFDEVTLADVARSAGVSQQTVVNHFGSKIGLYLTGMHERFGPRVAQLREGVVPGDVGSAVDVVLTDYEVTGDGAWRTSVLADRVPELREVVDGGHAFHRDYVERAFAPQLARRRGARRERLVVLLGSVLDVAMWKRLRRDLGLDREATAAHLRLLVEGVLEAG